ncbi:MAG TPA: MBL fold metallo-hydrolase [Solirubrobacteraceae bacterium]|nr:MBL fold metallo-hydrolase [Solirubrobacteraceae bacterium]
MRIRRLGWAGLEIHAAGATAVIDLFEEVGPMGRFIGPPRGPLPGPSGRGQVSLGLVTHLHADHADPRALARALGPGGIVLGPPRDDDELMPFVGAAFAKLGVEYHAVTLWETVEVGPFSATAVPAVDGFGDPQVSWALSAGDGRILHCGDTMFHGWWWLARERCGPFDAAFLPINGPIVSVPGRQPHSRLPAVMDPRQAAEAAALLQAELAIPIHYDTLENPPAYTQVQRPLETFLAEAEARGVRARALAAGEEVELAAPLIPEPA